MKLAKDLIFIFVIISMSISSSALYSKTKKLALVIGNSSYENAYLKNPINDANNFTKILQDIGFEVTSATNVNREQFENIIRKFSSKIDTNDVVLFYFSGHGSQVNGVNYLIPIKERIASEDEIRYKAINIDFIIDKFSEGKPSLNLILLDACRSNPFKGFRTINEGLSVAYAPIGTLISYATSPGKVAYDGTDNDSPYMQGLLEIIPKYGLIVYP